MVPLVQYLNIVAVLLSSGFPHAVLRFLVDELGSMPNPTERG